MSESTTRNIVVMGGTGACGRYIVSELLKRDDTKVVALGRRPVSCPPGETLDYPSFVESGRLVNVNDVNFEDPSTYREYVHNADAILNGLATTKKDAGSDEEFIRIDQGFVVKPAEVASESPKLKYFGYISAMNAKASSWFLYPRVKGETESILQSLNFPSLSIFRPGLILRGDLTRWNEKPFGWLSWMVPCSHDKEVGKAVVVDAMNALTEDRKETRFIENSDILKLNE